MTKSIYTTRMVSHAEARDAADRLIAGSFRRDGERLPCDCCPQFSVPADRERDSDLVLRAYLKQQEAADLVAAHTEEEARLADADMLARPSVTERFLLDGETWVDTMRREENGLPAGYTWRDAAFALAAALDEENARSAQRERMRAFTAVALGETWLARLPEELPDDIAQEAGQFYEQHAVIRPCIRKADAMRHAWREVIRPRVRRLEAAS